LQFQVRLGKLSQKEKDNSINEVRILASLHHPNICGYKEAFVEE
jgi:NIMA (never in mitosis gene a)-related kinase